MTSLLWVWVTRLVLLWTTSGEWWCLSTFGDGGGLRYRTTANDGESSLFLVSSERWENIRTIEEDHRRKSSRIEYDRFVLNFWLPGWNNSVLSVLSYTKSTLRYLIDECISDVNVEDSSGSSFGYIGPSPSSVVIFPFPLKSVKSSLNFQSPISHLGRSKGFYNDLFFVFSLLSRDSRKQKIEYTKWVSKS